MTSLLVSLVFVSIAGVVLTLHGSGHRQLQVAVVRQPARRRR
jgi:hypothetical protein